MGGFYILVAEALIIGLVTGIAIAIPIGPSGLESVRWTMSKGFKHGIWVAVGSVIADAMDVVLINFGLLSWIETNKLLEALFWLLSGLVTFYIGFRAVKSGKKYDPEKELEKEEKLLENKKMTTHPVFTGFIIAITYPMTHFSWLTFSTTFIRYWRSLGRIPYITFVAAMLLGIFICLTGINFLAAKGRKIGNGKKSEKLTGLLAYLIAALGVGFILFGLYRLAF
ncbi:MAG: LysE family transporter [Bacillota bacterium]|nr:LysE family transporter [Bacillota bacterium]